MKFLMKIPNVNRSGLLMALSMILGGLVFKMPVLWMPGGVLSLIWISAPIIPYKKWASWTIWQIGLVLTVNGILGSGSLYENPVSQALVIGQTILMSCHAVAIEYKRRSNDEIPLYTILGVISGILMIAAGFITGWSMVYFFVFMAYAALFSSLDR